MNFKIILMLNMNKFKKSIKTYIIRANNVNYLNLVRSTIMKLLLTLKILLIGLKNGRKSLNMRTDRFSSTLKYLVLMTL